MSSYDLGFWRETEGASLDDEEIYRRLCAGEDVEGLEPVDTESVLEGFERALPDFERVDLYHWESDEGSFSVYTTPQHVRVDCTDMSGAEMERLIAVAADHGCLSYDPQQGARIAG